MIAIEPENFERSRRQGLSVLGLRARHRKKAERMLPGDRVLFYLTTSQAFAATATVVSSFFEDHTPIWLNQESGPDDMPWRVRIRPNLVLDRADSLDAHQIAPRLMYLKRWPPEQWPLAFQGQVHLLSAQDFRLIEHEMERALQAHRGRPGHGRGPYRPDRPAGPPPPRAQPPHRTPSEAPRV
jgi:hypothetical protein